MSRGSEGLMRSRRPSQTSKQAMQPACRKRSGEVRTMGKQRLTPVNSFALTAFAAMGRSRYLPLKPCQDPTVDLQVKLEPCTTMETCVTKMAATGLFAAFLLTPVIALAQAEPPIQSPQDAACRDEARTRIFSGANPSGADLRSVGAGYYFECMRRTQAVVSQVKSKAPRTKAKRSKKRRSQARPS
jgi:hypothetical protein